MWTRSLKCCLVVVLFACAFLGGSDSVSANAYDGASASALSGSGAHEDAENIPGAHDRHKGIRSYDSTGFSHDNNADRGVKSYGTPSGHGANRDHGIKGGGHGYNKNRDDCSKCKWENDDYWERDEPEEEGDENDGDECDDGQYRPDKAHHHGSGTRHKSGSHPSGVHKTGPTGVYVDDGVKGGGSPGPLGGINYPIGTGYTRPISDYGTTPKPGSSWNTPFADASKPGGGTASTFGTTPSSWSNWNRGTTPGRFGSSPKPAWSGGHDGRFPSSQGPGASVPNFDATSKPDGQRWNTNQFPSGTSSAVPHTGSSIAPSSSYGNPQESQNRPYGQPGTQNSYAGAYAGTSATSGIGSPYGEAPIGRKDHPFGLNKPVNIQSPHGAYDRTDQTPSSTDRDIYYGLGGYDKPRPAGFHSTSTLSPTIVTNTFGTTKGIRNGGISSPRTVPGAQSNTFSGKSPGSPTGSGVYPGVTKPSYGGSTSSWLDAGQPGSGSSTWHGTGTTSYAGFPVSNTGFGTTKTPFSHVSIPSSTLTAPYDRTGPRQPGFNVASSSATANAGATAFGTSPSTYSTPSITGTPFYGTTPAHRGGPNYSPGVKGSVGSTRPAYGTVPHGTHPNIEGGTWPGRQPGSSTGPWSSGKSGDGSEITPGRYSPGASGILPGKQPQGSGTWPTGQPASGSGTWPTGQPASGSGTWPSKQPGDGSRTWPGQGQPGHESGPGCSNGNCGGAIASQSDRNCGGCCGNYNCNGCSGTGNNVPATHGLCGGIGPSGVNKTYYPAGTGDGNVPNIGPVYGPDSLNTEVGIKPVYPGINPGSTPSSISRPWTDTTEKPLGKGNPFLDSSWNGPKPAGYSNIYDDKNVIPYGKENTKPIGQGNPFLDGSNRRGDIGTNPNQGAIPLEEKIPKGDNPFLRPWVGGSNGSGGPSYGKQPDRSETPGSFPGSGTPGNYPGSGTPGNYPGSGTPGNYPGSGTPENYPGSEASSNYPGSGAPGNYPGSGTPRNYPGSGTPENYPGSGTPGNYPESRASGNYPGSGAPGSYPGSGASENYPGSGTPGNYPGSRTSGSSPGSGTSGNSPGSRTPGNTPGSEIPGNSGGVYSGVSPQNQNSGRSYPTGGNPQGAGPLQCKLGLFGCGTPGSGSYAGIKYPGGAIGGNVGTGTGNSGNIGNVPGGPENPGIASVSGHFAAGVGHPGLGGNNLATSVSGAHAGAYAGSFSSAQASSSNYAGSFSGVPGPANNIGGNWSPNGAQNQDGSNSWASSGASAFASSSSGSWSGNRPINVKG